MSMEQYTDEEQQCMTALSNLGKSADTILAEALQEALKKTKMILEFLNDRPWLWEKMK